MKTKYVILAFLLMGCKVASGGGETLDGGEDGDNSTPDIQVQAGMTAAEIVCAKIQAYHCVPTRYEIDGYISLGCAWNDTHHYVNGEEERKDSILETAAMIEADFQEAGITYTKDYSYDLQDADDAIYDSKLLHSDNGSQIHMALDWSNEALIAADGSGPVSAQALWIQIEDESLLEGWEACLE